MRWGGFDVVLLGARTGWAARLGGLERGRWLAVRSALWLAWAAVMTFLTPSIDGNPTSISTMSERNIDHFHALVLALSLNAGGTYTPSNDMQAPRFTRHLRLHYPYPRSRPAMFNI